MTNSLLDRLRDDDEWYGDEHVTCPVDEAVDILEFFFNQMQAYSPTMDGNCRYRFRSESRPMQYCVGNTPLEAARNAVAELKRERAASKNTD